MMTTDELKSKVAAIVAEIDDKGKWSEAGLRYESRVYQVGDVVADSKSNFERADERDFPVHGSKDYASLPELDGCCTYGVYSSPNEMPLSAAAARSANKHAYIIVGNEATRGEDPGEMIIKGGVVYAVLY
jgi:hypothetical protein